MSADGSDSTGSAGDGVRISAFGSIDAESEEAERESFDGRHPSRVRGWVRIEHGLVEGCCHVATLL